MGRTTEKVVIIGAGEVGATYAYALQLHGAAREIVLIDVNRERAVGQALDLSHGAFFSPAVEVRAGDYDECRDADVIAICAGAAQKPGQSRLELVGINVRICRQIMAEITQRTRDAIILMTTNPVDVLTNAAIQCSGLPAARVIGSGTVLDSARFRYLLSRHCDVSTQSIHAYVMGEHGDSEVLCWSLARLGGMKIEDCCRICPRQCPSIDRAAISREVRQSAYHIIDAKGATNFAIGQALVRITTAILRDEDSVLTVSTLLSGQYDIEGVCLSIPCIVGRHGVDRYLTPELDSEELSALRASAEAIRRTQKEAGLS